jgi:hypothetical protein
MNIVYQSILLKKIRCGVSLSKDVTLVVFHLLNFSILAIVVITNTSNSEAGEEPVFQQMAEAFLDTLILGIHRIVQHTPEHKAADSRYVVIGIRITTSNLYFRYVAKEHRLERSDIRMEEINSHLV